MTTAENTNRFKVLILEDDQRQNDVLTRLLKNYAFDMEISSDIEIDLRSYHSEEAYLRDLQNTGDELVIAFVDVNMMKPHVLSRLKKTCKNLVLVVLSGSRKLRKKLKAYYNGIMRIVFKDRNTVPICCLLLVDIVNQRLLGKNYIPLIC